MSTSTFLVQPVLAQTPVKRQVSSSPSPATPPVHQGSGQIWMFVSILLLLALIGLVVYGKLQINDREKKIKFEQFKNSDLQKKLKLALNTIRKMETNPDLVHSREFNLDYLRMRMDEEVFHFAIVNQIKIKVKQKISIALRPTQGAVGDKNGNAGSGRQVDSMFDIEYETG